MKLHLARADGHFTISSYGEGYVAVNGERHEGNLAILPTRLIPGWTSAKFPDLAEADFATLRDLGAEIVLLGTGSRIRFPHPALTRPLIDARIGLEVMDAPAACRTYNYLVAEGRNVVAALLWD